MKKMKKLSLAMLAVLLAAGMAGCSEAASNLQTTTTTTTAAAEPSAVPEELSDFDESTNVEHELSGLKFNAPKTWEVYAVEDGYLQLEIGYSYLATIMAIESNGEIKDIDEYTSIVLNAFKEEADYFSESSHIDTTVGGYPGIRIEAQSKTDSLEMRWLIYTIQYDTGYAAVCLSGSPLSPKSCLNDFEKVVSTVRYEPPAPVGIGETVDIIDDGVKLGTLTINSVSLTSDRNRFSDDDPAQVVIVNYTYENTDSSEDLYYFNANFQIIDAGGNVCDTYPADAGKAPKKTPKGAKCTAGEAFGLVEESEEVTIYFRTNMYDDVPAITFKVPVTAE